MKSRVSQVVAALAMGVSLALVAPVVASARTTVTTVGHSALTYRHSVKLIDHQFLAAVASAKRSLVNELSHAKTQGQRNTARARYRLAIALAITARDEALVALGSPPRTNVRPPGVPVTSPFGN